MKICARMCGACPFSNKSAPGWLGPYTIDDIHQMMVREYPFGCHLHIKKNATIEDVQSGKIPVCRGYIAMSKKSAKRNHGTMFEFQEQIKVDELENAMSISQFRKHHSKFLNKQ